MNEGYGEFGRFIGYAPQLRYEVWRQPLVAQFLDRADSRIDHRLERIVGGQRVIAHLDVELVFNDGVVVRGPLLIIFTFNSEGLIVLMEEYVNEAVFPIDYKERAAAKAAAAQDLTSID